MRVRMHVDNSKSLGLGPRRIDLVWAPFQCAFMSESQVPEVEGLWSKITIQDIVFGSKDLTCWVLGPSGRCLQAPSHLQLGQKTNGLPRRAATQLVAPSLTQKVHVLGDPRTVPESLESGFRAPFKGLQVDIHKAGLELI